MAWEHHTDPPAPARVFAQRMVRQILLVCALVGFALALGTAGYMVVSRGSENLGLVDSFLEASMFVSGAGPLYTERSSTDALKIFSALFALFSTLIVVSSVGILAAPIVHRVIHRLHWEKSRGG
jgi:hypothetical protein